MPVDGYVDYEKPIVAIKPKYKVGEVVTIGKIKTQQGSIVDRLLRDRFEGHRGVIEAVLNTKMKRYCVRPANVTEGTLRLDEKELCNA